MRNLWQLPLYAWLAAVYPVVSIAARNPGQADGVTVATAVIVALAVASVLGAGFRFLSGSWSRAALAVLVTALVFYGYGPAGGLAELRLLGMTDGEEVGFFTAHSTLVLTTVFAMLLLLGVAAALRAPVDLARRAAGPLNTVAALLIAFAGVEAIAAAGSRSPGDALPTTVVPEVDAGERPDIYLIVLDGYARRDVLSQRYGFDNSPFLGELGALGFSVVDGGNSNYNWTQLSLASSLNMNYLPEVFGGPIPAGSRDNSWPYGAIRDSETARFLQGLGYEFVQLQSTWGATRTNPHADLFLACGRSIFSNEFVLALAEASWLRALDSGRDLAACHLANFENLGGLGARQGPKFVLAHFVPPHHPYLFDSAGQVQKHATLANQFDHQSKLWEDKASYIEQLAFVNRAVIAAVATVLSTSERPPVVLIHSDHGPNLVEGLSEDESLRVRFANFAAVYAPGVDGELIPDGETPVNYFRRIFNEYFNAGFPILENRQYASAFRWPYRFSDVTSVVGTARTSLEGP
jgi:hypothetical protein